jgi:hypothetical protein
VYVHTIMCLHCILVIYGVHVLSINCELIYNNVIMIYTNEYCLMFLCNIGGMFLNNFSFADDMCVLSPSIAGLRKLLAQCELFANEHDIVYNSKKTVCMCVRPKRCDLHSIPNVSLYGEPLIFVDEFVYLGHVITNDLCDDRDIMRKYRSTCVRANVLRRKFSMCSNDVKLFLFCGDCTHIYCY